MFMFRALVSLTLLCCSHAFAQTPISVKVFPGSQVLPLWAGQAQAIFERHGLKLNLLFTRTSQEQRDGLAAGEFQVAHTAVDNAVAMVERAKHDVVVFMSVDSSMNELFTQPEVRSIADLKGRIAIVDAPNTAFAIQLKKILLLHGLKANEDYKLVSVGSTFLRYSGMRKNPDYAASMLNPPFSVDAAASGLKSLGRAVDLLGPYQGFGAIAMRSWARANADTLERYIASYIESLQWVLAPQNKVAAATLLSEKLKVEPAVASRTLELMADPKFGLTPDARIDMAGFANVLKLRAEIEGDWGGTPPPPERYVDLSYYENALKRVSR
jgi:ABC-type nitrate/sulfonate/bicarbonate transport system substrate-binding protein